MIGYIHENADALQRTLVDNELRIQSLVARIRKEGIQRMIISGIGSSYTAAMMAAPIFRYHSTLPVHILPVTDLGLYGERLINAQTLVIVISRTGERSWVVRALQESIARGAYGVAMTGVASSLLAQSAQQTLITGEGTEISFPKTKSVTVCAGLLMRLALALAGSEDLEAPRRLEALRNLPSLICRTVEVAEPRIQELMPFIKTHDTLLACGTGSNYGVALETAVKVQEAAYVTTLCDDTGNMLHGPLSPLSSSWLLVPLVSQYDLELSKDLLRLASRFGAHSLSIVEPGLDLEDLSDQQIVLPEPVDPLLSGLVYLPPIQLLTYFWTLAGGRNPDLPEAAQAILEAILPDGRSEPDLVGG
jgi:glucosamine 6-phosphate synthetase-like amidotransferase/phosphosugar isomerase protein